MYVHFSMLAELPKSDDEHVRRTNKRIVICKNEDDTTALIKIGTKKLWKRGKFVQTNNIRF